MKLGKAEPFGMLDDDHACLRHINADLDDRRRDKKLRRAASETLHRRVAGGWLHLAMRQRHLDPRKRAGKRLLPFLGRGDIQLFRFLDKRADPVGALARCQRRPQPVDHLAKPVKRQRAGLYGKPAGGFFIQPRMIQIAIGRHRQRTRDRGRRHHDDIDPFAFLPQQHTLAHAEPVLFVNHGKAEVVIGHTFRDQRMRADHDLRAAILKGFDHRFAVAAATLAKKKMRLHAKWREKGVDAGMMLACQHLGRGEKGGLRAGFHCVEHGGKRHQRLAGPDIPLQHPQHASRGLLVRADFRYGAGLGTGWREGQRRHQRGGQRPGAGESSARHAVLGGVPDKRQCQLVGQKLVKGKATSRL